MMIKSKSPKVVIVIVGFNSKKYLDACFKSIASSTYSKYKIIFIDNNSQDDSCDYVRSNYPHIIVNSSNNNNGFAKGNNIGIKKAIKLGAKYVFLLNPDTIIDKNCLSLLLEKANEKTILQPLILLHDGKKKTNLINTSGNVIHYLGFSWCDKYNENIRKAGDEEDIVGASGASMLIPVTMLKTIGLLDEMLFMYYEDTDISMRAHLARYSVRIIPQAKVWHEYQFTMSSNKFFYLERNRLLFILKYYPLSSILLLFPLWIVSEIGILLYAIKHRFFITKIKSYMSILHVAPIIFRERGKISRAWLRSERKLSDYCQSRIQPSIIDIPLLSVFDHLSYIYLRTIRTLL